MTTTTTAEAHAVFAPGAHGDTIRGLETVSEVQAYILRERPGTNKRFAQRSADRLVKFRDEAGTFYECLRILGMTTDTTARDAVRNIERSTP